MKSCIFTLMIATALAASSQASILPASDWEARIVQGDDFVLSFRCEITVERESVTGSFFNGDIRVSSTSGSLRDNRLELEFAHYATTLKATLDEGVLRGVYGSERRGFSPFEARPAGSSPIRPDAASPAPQIGGVWTIPTETEKGEKAWSLIIRQERDFVSAAILRIDGDTGAIEGRWEGDHFALQKFDGARGYTLRIQPSGDGTLVLDLRSSATRPATRYTALRPDEAASRGLTPPNDSSSHIRIKDPSERFRFSFPDLNGNIVSDTDARFRGKVIVLAVGGSWCPNCHDEAPFLKELHHTYRDLGLEVVSLSFEEAAQMPGVPRLRAFIAKYGLDFTYLLGGDRREVNQKLPQAINLNTWPASFIIGRDSRVRATHAGFAAPATGDAHEDLRRKFISTIERLLAESTPLNPISPRQ